MEDLDNALDSSNNISNRYSGTNYRHTALGQTYGGDTLIIGLKSPKSGCLSHLNQVNQHCKQRESDKASSSVISCLSEISSEKSSSEKSENLLLYENSLPGEKSSSEKLSLSENSNPESSTFDIASTASTPRSCDCVSCDLAPVAPPTSSMGCTPSIHVSQTRVVFCQDSADESSSPINPASVSVSAPKGSTTTTTAAASAATTTSGSASGVSHITTTVLTTVVGSGAGQAHHPLVAQTSTAANSSYVEKQYIQGAISISEAETQTTRDYINMKGGSNPIELGPMQISQQPMSVLLVFAKEDAQSDGFWWAADKGGYVCNLSRTAEGALETFLDKRHHLVIVDARTSKHFDAEALCRSIRKSNEGTVIIAVTKRLSGEKEEPSIVPLLNAGFNRRFIENPSISVCLNELVSLEHGEVRNQVKLTAASACVKALELSTEAIQITSDQHVTQYVNPAYERLFGYNNDELHGENAWTVPSPGDKGKQDAVQARLRMGESWEGIYTTKRKGGGESIPHHCRISPVNTTGKVHHFVSIKSPLTDTSHALEKYPTDLSQLHNGGLHTYTSSRRRESFARIHSMTIEAPITKVINIITAAQENSPIAVINALDKVLEILQSAELYSPYFGAQVMKDDQMTNDLVGGLMATSREHSLDIQSTRSARSASQSMKRRSSGQDHGGIMKNPPSVSPNPTATSMILSNVPHNIQELLKEEESWNFDILQLERITNKQALVYLGLKTFQRFGVMDYLHCTEETMCNWLQLIEANYQKSNTYHNSTHAADVMQASAYFLSRERIKNIMEPTDEVVSLIAATVHDLNHPGKTNSFLVNAGHELAVLYNDLAVLENHHAALAFQLTTKNDNTNIFKNVDKDDLKVLRQQIIDMVLATEMTKHFEHLNKFVSSANAIVKEDERELSASGKSSPDSMSTSSHQQRLGSVEMRTLIKRMLIKCADVSNPLRPLQLCKEWAFRISEEYFKQTDEEKRLDLPVVMPVFDRKSCNVPKSQTSFIDFFIKDMFDAWDTFCDINDPITHLQTNYTYWKEQEPKAAQELLERQKREEEEAPAASS